MANLIYRVSTNPSTPPSTSALGSPLSNAQIDGNFKSLNDELITKSTSASPTFTGAITLNSTFVNGAQLKTGTSVDNTLALSAYDVDGTAYTDLVKLTAGNTPLLEITSTATGSINNMTVGATTAATGKFTTLNATSTTTLDGNLIFNGAGARITGDFSNATVASRVAFQSSTTNGVTGIIALPNGTATAAAWRLYNSSDILNSSIGDISLGNVSFDIRSYNVGTGAYLPMTFAAGGSERMRIDSSGNVGVGTTTPTALRTKNLEVSSSGTNDGAALIASKRGTGIATLRLGAADATNGWDLNYNYPNTDDLSFNKLGSGAGTKLTIDSNGNVGIGTTTPTYPLTIGPSTVPSNITVLNALLSTDTAIGANLVVRKSYTGANGPNVQLAKSRGTAASPSIVSNGDILGQYYFFGYDGTNYQPAAAIVSYVDATPGTNDMPGCLSFLTTSDGSNTAAEKMRISSSGAIGLSGANYGTAGQVLVSNGSAAAPAWGISSMFVANGLGDAGTVINAVANTHYHMWAGNNVRLPDSPVVGWTISIYRHDGACTVLRNSTTPQPIMSIAEDLVIDSPRTTVTLRFVESGTLGWAIV